MDVLRHNGIRQIVVLLDQLALNNLGLEEEVTSYTITPVETKERGRKSHIPSVTTVPREDAPLSGDRQARWRPIAVRDEKKKTIDPSPAVTDGKTTEAESGQIHDTPNTVERALCGRPFISGRNAGQQSQPPPGGRHWERNPRHCIYGFISIRRIRILKSIWANCNMFTILWPESSLSPLDLPAANHC